MVNLVFVVDTSASMNQRTSLGTTLLDVAKNAVETFVKVKENRFCGMGHVEGMCIKVFMG